MSDGANYIYLIPVRNKGQGAHSRFECFLRIEELDWLADDRDVVRGEVVDEYGQHQASDFTLKREHVKAVYRALPNEHGRLVTVMPSKAGT